MMLPLAPLDIFFIGMGTIYVEERFRDWWTK